MITETSSTQAGFSPDSVYAGWTDEEREINDRMEVDYNRHRRTVLAMADEKQHHTVRGMADESLRRLSKVYRRELEDLEDGDTLEISSSQGRSRKGISAKRALEIKIRDIQREQEFRAALAESWLASEDGTHSYTGYEARGGLVAVLDHGAGPVSYQLAALLDQMNFHRGQPSVFEWKAE